MSQSMWSNNRRNKHDFAVIDIQKFSLDFGDTSTALTIAVYEYPLEYSQQDLYSCYSIRGLLFFSLNQPAQKTFAKSKKSGSAKHEMKDM